MNRKKTVQRYKGCKLTEFKGEKAKKNGTHNINTT